MENHYLEVIALKLFKNLWLSRLVLRNAAAMLLAIISAGVLSCSIFALLPFEGEKELYSGIIRFHVLANSDSERDQELKLLVRDEVTVLCENLLKGCESLSEAKSIIAQNEEEILSVAEACIARNGFDYKATLSQGQAVYPRREYSGLTFPAGSYYSVRLSIGEGHGKNWWCVLFPSVTKCCATVEECNDESGVSLSVFSDSELDIIKEDKSARKEIRFFFLDFINGTLGKE